MTVVEKKDSSPESAQQGEEMDLLDHGALIKDMNRSDKLSLEERAKKARTNRRLQLKLFSKYDRAEEEQEASKGNNRSITISFPHDVALMDAAAKGAVEDMKHLLEKGLDPNAKNQEGLTALHNSCIDGNPEIVNLLLKHGASVNVSDKDGWTPLHAAATCGYPKVVKSLIASGADLLVINGDGDMPYDIADDEETLGIIEDAMRDKGITNETIEEKRTELHAIVLADVKALIDEKEDLDIPVNEEGATLLHVAIANHFNDVVELLLDNGASVDSQDIEGWKPVHAAAFFSNDDALEMLVMKKGADLRAATDSGLEPLDLVDQPTARKNILTLMDADPNKYKVENKKPIERGSTTPHIFEEVTDALSQDESASDQNIDTILPVIGESTEYDDDGQILKSLDEHNEFLPVLKRVESISTKRNSMREAKKQAPTIKSSNTTRKDSLDIYDNSYELLLTKKKSNPSKPSQEVDNDPNFSSVQTLGKIYENDDRSEDSNATDQATDAHLEPTVIAIPLEVKNRNGNEPSTENETSKSGAILQISAEYGNVLKNQVKKEPPKSSPTPPGISSRADTDPVVLQASPFEDKSSPKLNDNKTDPVISSETASTASSTQEDFLVELKRAIRPRAVTPHKQNTATDLHENDPPTHSIPKKDSVLTYVYESDVPSMPNENDPPPSVYENDQPAKARQETDLFPKTVHGREAQTQSLHEKDPQITSSYENEPQNSTLYENELPIQPLYENVQEVATSNKKSSEVKVETETRPNQTSTKPVEPLYAVVDKTKKNDPKKSTEKESTNSTVPTNKSKSSTTSGNVKPNKGTDTLKNGTSNSQKKNSSPPPFGVPNDRERDSTTASSPPPVPLRKKFDRLVDERVRSTEPVRPGTLQELKLKRQKNRQSLLLEDDDLSPVISRGLESMVYRGMGEVPLSPKTTFRPPDSPTRNRKVFKAPELTTEERDTNIFKHKKRCNVM